MTEVKLVGDGPDREPDWTLDEEAGRVLGTPEGERQPLKEVGRRFSRNVATTIVARVVNMARGVLLVPFLLAHIGLEAYGIWTTIFILVTYVGLTTLGISNVYIKYVAEFHARKEYDKANSLLSTGLAVTIPACAGVFLVFFFGWSWIAPILHLPPAHARDGKEAVLIVLGVFLSSIALNVFADMLTGTQQIAATQVFLTIGIVAEFGIAVGLVLAGRGIAGLAEAYLVRTVINDGLAMWWAWRTLKWLRLSPRLIRRESLKYVVHFGGLVQFQSMLSIFLASVERVAALMLIGAGAAGLLDVARKWPISLSAIPTAFFSALLPAAAHVDAASKGAERKGNLRELYLSGARYSGLSTACFVALMMTWATPIVHVWLGDRLPMRETLVPLFVLFSFGMHLHMLTGAGTSVFRGMGRVYEEFWYSIPNLLLLAVALPAARWIEGKWTPWGIGVAVTVATVLSACMFMGRVLVVLDIELTQFLRVVIAPGLIPYLVAGALAWPAQWLVSQVNRWAGAALLVAAGLAYLAAMTAIAYRWVLTSEERFSGTQLVRKSISILRGREAEA